MKRRAKPHVNSYRKLLVYAKGVGIKVEVKEEPSDGVYIPTRKTIRLDEDLEGADLIATFLHELGHHLSDQFYERHVGDEVSIAYGKVYGSKKIPTWQLKLVVACERRAWHFGEIIAKMLNIKLGKWYSRFTTACIKEYKEQ